MRDKKYTYILIGNLRERDLEREIRRRRKDEIKFSLKGIGYEEEDWFNLANERF
jgi:hypothetical protein